MDEPKYASKAAEILAIRDFAIKAGVRGAAELADEAIRRDIDPQLYHTMLKRIDVDEQLITPIIGLVDPEDNYDG